MSKLPVLYLSCETEALTGPKGQESLRRLVPREQVVDSVAVFTSEEGFPARHLQSNMKARGFEVAVSGSRDPGLKLLAESMMQLVPEEAIELRLKIPG